MKHKGNVRHSYFLLHIKHYVLH